MSNISHQKLARLLRSTDLAWLQSPSIYFFFAFSADGAHMPHYQ